MRRYLGGYTSGFVQSVHDMLQREVILRLIKKSLYLP